VIQSKILPQRKGDTQCYAEGVWIFVDRI